LCEYRGGGRGGGKGSGPKKRRDNVVTFDAEERREFITGFRKRRQERQKRVRDENEKKEREAKKEVISEVCVFVFLLLDSLIRTAAIFELKTPFGLAYRNGRN
jgi:hypothetical protein